MIENRRANSWITVILVALLLITSIIAVWALLKPSEIVERTTTITLTTIVTATTPKTTATTTTTPTTTATSTSSGKVVLRLVTTQSFAETGLLSALKTIFEKQNPDIDFTWDSGTWEAGAWEPGTGMALGIARRGDADFVITDTLPQEEQFINDGYGIHGVRIAYSDYVIVGPASDPANVNSTKTAVNAFKRISESGMRGKITFMSRADKSAINARELEIWLSTGVNACLPCQAWYRETREGMAQTLTVTNNLQGYTLTDRATYNELKSNLNLKIVFEKDPPPMAALYNIYRAILINPEKFPNLHYAEAEKFILFLVSPEIQNFIGNYTKDGQKLLNPLFGKFSELGFQIPYEDQEVTYWRSKLGQ
jgi:tungstate transport system substrate-binding protein